MASYSLFTAIIQRNEGGYQNLKTDWGNKNSLGEFVGTNFGVSAVVYEGIIGRPPTVADMKNITQSEAHQIFKNRFWDKVKGDRIQTQKNADTIADHAINSHPVTATRLLQRVLNEYFAFSLSVDGVLGEKTLAALNSVDQNDLFVVYSQYRIEDYKTKRTCNHFCPIWFNRVEHIAKQHKVDIAKKITPIEKSVATKIKEVATKKKTIVLVGGVSLLLLTGWIIYSKSKK